MKEEDEGRALANRTRGSQQGKEPRTIAQRVPWPHALRAWSVRATVGQVEVGRTRESKAMWRCAARRGEKTAPCGHVGPAG
jgi:hypothetical protein